MTDFPSDPETETFKDGDPLVTALVWEVDRAVKQAMREGGKYDTTIRHILNEHLRGLAQTPTETTLKNLIQVFITARSCGAFHSAILDNAIETAQAALSDTSTDRTSK